MRSSPSRSFPRCILMSSSHQRNRGTHMNRNTFITIIAILTITSLNAEEVSRRIGGLAAGQVAKTLVNQFDQDNTSALNALELSNAVDYVIRNYPFLTSSLDYSATAGEVSASPRIAVGLVDGFDSNNDVQLTDEELALAITYLRRLERDNRGLVAMAD